MSDNCIKVGIVNYKNTLPLLFGLEKMEKQGKIELVKDYPSKIASLLQSNTIDIGLIPVASIPTLKNPKIISNFCIGTHNKVASVCLFSQVPITAIKNVYLDYQSNTSVQLVKILFKHYWQQEVNFLPAPPNFIELVQNDTAAVIIGDRAFEQLPNFLFVYDLAEAWHLHTGLDFVFAAWVSCTPLPEKFIEDFNAFNEEGLQYLPEIARNAHYPHYNLEHYFTHNIKYKWDDALKGGFEHFKNLNL